MNEFVYSVLNQNEISIRIVSAEMPWQLMVAVNFSDVRELITSNCTFAPLCRKIILPYILRKNTGDL